MRDRQSRLDQGASLERARDVRQRDAKSQCKVRLENSGRGTRERAGVTYIYYGKVTAGLACPHPHIGYEIERGTVSVQTM
jgi:hypothetical protein